MNQESQAPEAAASGETNAELHVELAVEHLPLSARDALRLRCGMQLQIEASQPVSASLRISGTAVAEGELMIADGVLRLNITKIHC